mmetsp:Transcript_82410/g.233218  ORF Transcript_82410/g.233218 Transcript_82410/m.233218 type:complete len:331 (-) Transcript_82410:410-1402(-)
MATSAAARGTELTSNSQSSAPTCRGSFWPMVVASQNSNSASRLASDAFGLPSACWVRCSRRLPGRRSRPWIGWGTSLARSNLSSAHPSGTMPSVSGSSDAVDGVVGETTVRSTDSGRSQGLVWPCIWHRTVLSPAFFSSTWTCLPASVFHSAIVRAIACDFTSLPCLASVFSSLITCSAIPGSTSSIFGCFGTCCFTAFAGARGWGLATCQQGALVVPTGRWASLRMKGDVRATTSTSNRKLLPSERVWKKNSCGGLAWQVTSSFRPWPLAGASTCEVRSRGPWKVDPYTEGAPEGGRCTREHRTCTWRAWSASFSAMLARRGSFVAGLP